MNHDHIAGIMARQRIDTLAREAASERLAQRARRARPTHGRARVFDRLARLVSRGPTRQARAPHARVA
jgi:hypothetical protein